MYLPGKVAMSTKAATSSTCAMVKEGWRGMMAPSTRVIGRKVYRMDLVAWFYQMDVLRRDYSVTTSSKDQHVGL